MLKNGLNWLADIQKEKMSEDVLYASKGNARHVKAVVCNTEVEVDGDDAQSFTANYADFIFHSEDIAGTPEPGDRITYAGKIYEIRKDSISGGWRYADPYRNRIRVHTQIIGKA